MASLYLLSEDDSDDQAFIYLLEMMRGKRFEPVFTRLRRGGGVGAVRRTLLLLAQNIERAGLQEDAYFLVALDNDRALAHSSHVGTTPSHPDCRHCGLIDALAARLPNGRPIPGAVAVPVEMLESWLLLLHDGTAYPAEDRLPRFARSSQEVARRLHGPNPPPQLKDLLEDAIQKSGLDRDGFLLDVVLRLDADDLAQRSPSFRLFRQQVSAW